MARHWKGTSSEGNPPLMPTVEVVGLALPCSPTWDLHTAELLAPPSGFSTLRQCQLGLRKGQQWSQYGSSMTDSGGAGTLDAEFSSPSHHPCLTSPRQGNISSPWTEQGMSANSWVVTATKVIKFTVYMKSMWL